MTGWLQPFRSRNGLFVSVAVVLAVFNVVVARAVGFQWGLSGLLLFAVLARQGKREALPLVAEFGLTAFSFLIVLAIESGFAVGIYALAYSVAILLRDRLAAEHALAFSARISRVLSVACMIGISAASYNPPPSYEIIALSVAGALTASFGVKGSRLSPYTCAQALVLGILGLGLWHVYRQVIPAFPVHSYLGQPYDPAQVIAWSRAEVGCFRLVPWFPGTICAMSVLVKKEAVVRSGGFVIAGIMGASLAAVGAFVCEIVIVITGLLSVMWAPASVALLDLAVLVGWIESVLVVVSAFVFGSVSFALRSPASVRYLAAASLVMLPWAWQL